MTDLRRHIQLLKDDLYRVLAEPLYPGLERFTMDRLRDLIDLLKEKDLTRWYIKATDREWSREVIPAVAERGPEPLPVPAILTP